ncbi:MAG: hypothetical protein VX884_00280 [Pseudomonadota bacterium]|nr:hypothetical protein [Pseudomonadota bacterium]
MSEKKYCLYKPEIIDFFSNNDGGANRDMLSGTTLPRKRRLFKKRGAKATAGLPLVILSTCASIALVVAIVILGSHHSNHASHAGKNTSHIQQAGS